ncbi:MAG: DNA topoisomerase IB [Verrucomicrobiota bacterium]
MKPHHSPRPAGPSATQPRPGKTTVISGTRPRSRPPAAAVLPELRRHDLVFTHDGMPGYSRRRHGQSFRFFLPDGGALRDPLEKRRLLSLAIPPAYRDVWICVKPNGHLQATGMDDRGRKQYRYHPQWSALSAGRKFTGLTEFARALPGLRGRVNAALTAEGFDKERIIAGIVGLLDHTGYRIGNRRYVRENRSYGLVSLLVRHLVEEEGAWILRFRGKSGQWHRAPVRSARLAALVAELHELPGQHLFRYEDGAGGWHDLNTADVNDWLKNEGGGDFTAKQFRTWRATVLCARALSALPPPEAERALKAAETAAIRQTAAMLHHTPATCRKYYLHPEVFAAFRTGRLHQLMSRRPPKFRQGDPAAGLRADERRVLWLIEHPVRKPRRS